MVSFQDLPRQRHPRTTFLGSFAWLCRLLMASLEEGTRGTYARAPTADNEPTFWGTPVSALPKWLKICAFLLWQIFFWVALYIFGVLFWGEDILSQSNIRVLILGAVAILCWRLYQIGMAMDPALPLAARSLDTATNAARVNQSAGSGPLR